MSILPTCGNCGLYVPPHEVAAYVAARSGIKPNGTCQRYPQSVPKSPTGYCGEHRPETPDEED